MLGGSLLCWNRWGLDSDGYSVAKLSVNELPVVTWLMSVLLASYEFMSQGMCQMECELAYV